MNSSSWMNALEKFDRDVDINSLTKKEVSIETITELSLFFIYSRLSIHSICCLIIKNDLFVCFFPSRSSFIY